MNRTGRGKRKKLLENYETPEWAVHRLLESIEIGVHPSCARNARWLEPCAGRGNIIKAVNNYWGRTAKINWTAIEANPRNVQRLRKIISPERVIHGNYFDQKLRKGYAVIISNPAFTIAYEVIQKSLLYADYVIMLLRIEWLSTAKRHDFISAHVPDVYVLPNRPSYTGDGNTDSSEYGWFIWPPKNTDFRVRTVGKIKILNLTDKATRKAHRVT